MKHTSSRTGPHRLRRGAVAALGAISLLASPAAGAVGAVSAGTSAPMSESDNELEASPLTFGGHNGTVPRTHGQVFEAYVGPGDNLDIGATVHTIQEQGQFTGGSVHVVVIDAAGNTVHDEFHPVDSVGDTLSVADLTGAPGVWKIDMSSFKPGNTANDIHTVFDWGIHPQDGDGNYYEGRVWAAERHDSNGLSLYRAQQPGFTAGLVDTAEDVTAYFLSDTGVIYRGTYLDYQGFTSYIGADSLGLATASCNPAYTSAFGAANAAATSLPDGAGTQYRTAGDCDNAVVYRTFFEEPDPTMPETAPSYRGNTWVYRDYEGPAFPTLTGVVPGDNTYANTQITYTLEGQPGVVTIEVDTTGTGDFTNPLTYTQHAKVGSNTYVWDGSGTPRDQAVHVRVSIEQTGEIHFLNADVENRTGGIQIEQLTGPGQGFSDLHWNDELFLDRQVNGNQACVELPDPQQSLLRCTTPNPQASGAVVSDGTNSEGGVHGWGAPNVNSETHAPWGNVRVIDDWTFIEDAAQSEIVLLPVAEQDPDLRINKTQVGDAVIEDDGSYATITWTIEAGNHGEGAADNVQVTDTLPEQADPATLTVVDGPTQGVFSAGMASWSVGTLEPGQEESITLRAQVELSGQDEVFVNQARIGNREFPPPAPGEGCQVNENLAGDNDQCDEVETPIELDPSLAINKEQTGEPVISEDGTSATITWTVQAGNLGLGSANDVVVTDTLPEQADPATLTVVGGPSQGSFDVASATWSVGTLTAGQTEQVRLSADVALTGDPQVFLNQARIGNPEFPPPAPGEGCVANGNLAGDDDQCDEVETPVELDPSLAVNKEQVGEAVIHDDSTATITWSIEAGNFGPGNADDVTVTDTLPEAVDPATVEVVQAPSKGSFDTETATWTIGELDRGQTATITLSADVALNGDEQVFVNQARIGNPEFPPPGPEEPCAPNPDLPGDEDQCDEVETPVDPDPELKVNKENVGEPVISDDGATATITWLIEAGNTGVGNADKVTVTDLLPQQVDPASVEIVEGPSKGTFNAETMTWTVGGLDAGQSESMTLSGVVVLTSSEQDLVNQARIGNPEFPPPGPEEPCVVNPDLPGDDDQCDQVETPVPPTSPDLKINKAAVGEPVFAQNGEHATITWSIETGNFGDRVAPKVTVSDVLPEQVDPASVKVVDGPTQGEFNTEAMVWNVGTLAIGQTETITFSGVVDTTSGEEITLVNGAYVENPEFPHDPDEPCVTNPDLPSDDDRCDEVEVPVPPKNPILQINKAVEGAPVFSDNGETGTLTWTIQAGNYGDRIARDVTVTDLLPEQIDPATVELVSLSVGEFDAEAMVWTIGDLPINRMETITFSGSFPIENGDVINLVNTAVIENPQFPRDPNDPENPCVPNLSLPGDDDQCDFVELPIDPLNPDLKINKAAEGGPVFSDDGQSATITWTIEAGNFGGRTAHEVSVTDVLPEGVDPASVTVTGEPTQGTFDAETMTWTIGTMLPGAIETMSFSGVVDVSDGQERNVVNGAYIENPEFPFDPEDPCIPNEGLPGDDDRCDEVEVPVDPNDPDLKINKEIVGEPELSEDGESALVTWSIEVGNLGARTATDVTVTDVLPEQVDPATVEVVEGPSQGEFDTETMVWTVGDLLINQTESMTFSAVVDTTSGQDEYVVNTAYVQNPQFPVDPEDPCIPNEDLPGDEDQCDWVEVPFDPTNPDLKINKSVVDGPIFSEDGESATITWAIEAGNLGNRVAHDVTVTDLLPEQVDPASVEVVDGPTQGEFDAETMTWTVGTLAIDQVETITFSGVVDTTGGEGITVVNEAYIENPEFPFEPVDPEEPCVPNEDLPGDDDQCDWVEVPVDPTNPDLRINKAVEGEPVIAEDGETAVITWVIETGNFGGRVAHDVTVTDVLPDGVDAETVEVIDGPTQGEFDAESMVWTVGSLAVNQTESITFSAVVDTTPGEESVFVNRAYVENPEFPANPEEPCVPNEDLAGDDDRCDFVETPIAPEKPADPVDPEPVDPEPEPEPKPEPGPEPVKPPIDSGDPSGSTDMLLVGGGALLLLLGGGAVLLALRRKEDEEESEQQV